VLFERIEPVVRVEQRGPASMQNVATMQSMLPRTVMPRDRSIR
jgi:hypothetical protein